MKMPDVGDASWLAVLASAVTGMFQWVNGWVSEFMPLFTAIGIVGGLFIQWWYRQAKLEQDDRHHREVINDERD